MILDKALLVVRWGIKYVSLGSEVQINKILCNFSIEVSYWYIPC